MVDYKLLNYADDNGRALPGLAVDENVIDLQLAVEIFEEKGVVTSDGAKAWSRLVRPEFRVVAVARNGSAIQRASDTVGVTGAGGVRGVLRGNGSSGSAYFDSVLVGTAKPVAQFLPNFGPRGGRRHRQERQSARRLAAPGCQEGSRPVPRQRGSGLRSLE